MKIFSQGVKKQSYTLEWKRFSLNNKCLLKNNSFLRKLENFERDREKISQPDPELLRKLDDSEALVRKLHHENSELRRENSATSSNAAGYQHRDSYYHRNDRSGPDQVRSNNGRSRGNYKGNWFPPLHSQSYWQVRKFFLTINVLFI